MNSVVTYHFPDATTLKNTIEANRAMIDRHWDVNNPFLCQIEELAMIHLSDKDKTEDEIKAIVASFFKMPSVESNRFTRSLGSLIVSSLPEVNAEFVSNIRKTLIECAKFPGRGPQEEPTCVAAVRASQKYDLLVSDLYIAAEWGFAQEAKEIITVQPESISSQTSFGTSPLQIACHKGHLEIVQSLLEAGANLQQGDNKGIKALDFAIKALLPSNEIHYQIVETLLKKGKELGLKIEEISGTHLLFEACARPKAPIISLLFEYGVKIEEQGYESLKSVVKMGRNDIIPMLLANGIKVDPVQKGEQSALYVAIFFDHFDVFLTLLRAGASLDLQDRTGVGPLHLAALKGRERMAEILVERGADINLRDKKGFTPLIYAVSGGHQELAKKLTLLGAKQ